MCRSGQPNAYSPMTDYLVTVSIRKGDLDFPMGMRFIAEQNVMLRATIRVQPGEIREAVEMAAQRAIDRLDDRIGRGQEW